ncbi:MAG: hypothetical protein VZQ83_07805 [Eubacterium sp.]|nr:hypothetical protein [Eubacterium sp.]
MHEAGIFGWIYETLFYMYNYDGLIVMRGSGFGPWIDIAYNDIAGYMFGMPDAAQLYSRLGLFSPTP